MLVGQHRLAEVDDGEVGAARPDVGEQDVPAARGEREPVGRSAAPSGRPGAVDRAARRGRAARRRAVLTVVRASPAAGTRSALLTAVPEATSRATVLSVTAASSRPDSAARSAAAAAAGTGQHLGPISSEK